MTRTRLGWAAAVVVALALGWWGGRATFEPPRPAAADHADARDTYTVVAGKVGRTMQTTAVVTWPLGSAAAGGATGTVTSVTTKAGAKVAAGDVLFTVDLRPVVVAAGSVPAFRDLAVGAHGADVRQLQALLRAVGVTKDAPSGRFTAATAGAVKAWQKRLGVEATGTVSRGDVVYVAALPARVVLTDAVQVGRTLGPGTDVLAVVPATPRVALHVDESQRAQVPTRGAAVHVTGPHGTWDAVVADERAGDDGLELRLAAANGGPACGDACSSVPFSLGGARYAATVDLSPQVSGALVPLSALGTAADGSAYVLDAQGARRPVAVTGQDGSRAVVTGVSPGEVVELFAQAQAQAATVPAPTASAG